MDDSWGNEIEQPSSFVLDAPGSLSERAQRFLRTNATRVDVDRGPTGDVLRARMREVYGHVDEQVVELLDAVQARYAGLEYRSGFFGSDIARFQPACEPETADEELEILYAVVTLAGGARLNRTGQVEIIFNGAGVVEFADLDGIIESDSMFAVAEALPFEVTKYVEKPALQRCRTLEQEESLALRVVPEASGRRTLWLTSESLAVFVCPVWADMGLLMPPMVKVWSAERDSPELARVMRVLA